MALVQQKDLLEYFRIAQQLGRVQKYKKYGHAQARLGQGGEVIVTKIDGKKETQNTVGPGDIVIKNPDGEVYPISKGKYQHRYTGPKLTSEFQEVKSKGEAYACRWLGDNIKFENEQGEAMVLNNGDMLATSSLSNTKGFYRIEKGAFEKTYIQATN
ncbi:hypothetical protein HWC21_gp190 [Vibrio phage VAP7]|uniref:Uncharacterized protein n=2 Tax=Vapseptimavirus VAP7 TaxID=2841303 RepID=A0A4Y5TVH8_9CAUD|nr:hypothetical protein HWC21_gp190 [Vibrio phage VAP7]AWY10181.1 hypothetical protein [Vibrio phage VP-1]QDB73372.1 hypothetical protein [Vibrio phage VAP7]UFD98136.1 hypothetical protein [Vibrio phage BX-1]